MTADPPKISLVVPVLNEEGSLWELYRQISESGRINSVELEVIFVDDGSTDGSWAIIRELADSQMNVGAIRFRRNFGKAAALTAGMARATGECIMSMDADLQDDPAEIPNFLAKLDEGYDVVNGWKQRRLDPWHKVYPSKVFNWLIGFLTGLWLHDHNCGVKLIRAEVAEEIRLYGEMHRFVPVLAHSRGFRVTEIPVHHRPREHGQSKYGVRRFLRGFLDLLTIKFLTGFGQRPQHMLGAFGLVLFALGIAGLTYLGLVWMLMNVVGLMEPEPIGNRPLVAYSVAATLLGAQAISLGLLAELVVAYTGHEHDTFSVSEEL